MPFRFDTVSLEHPLCTKSELVYQLLQRLSWQAAAQLGKLLGHSEMLGNPMGMIEGVGSGVAGAVRGVGLGIIRADGELILNGSRQLMGSVVGGAAGLGARFTGSLHSVVQKMATSIAHLHQPQPQLQPQQHFQELLAQNDTPAGSNVVGTTLLGVGRPGGSAVHSRIYTGGGGRNSMHGGGTLGDLKRGVPVNIKDGFKEGGKHALRTAWDGVSGLLLRPLQGAQQDGTLGLARGIADGAINFVLQPIAAAAEASAVVLHTVERAALGAEELLPPPQMRPARSFYTSLRLLPLQECMMMAFDLQVPWVAINIPVVSLYLCPYPYDTMLTRGLRHTIALGTHCRCTGARAALLRSATRLGAHTNFHL